MDGKDGSPGADGVSPTVSVSKSGKVTTVSITDKSGTKTATINDGADGKTPVKGTDYFTDADKQEIAERAAELVEIPDVDLTGYATEEYVKNKIAEAELGGEEVDLSGYAKKSELPTKVSQLENDSGYLTEHQDVSGKLDASALPSAINSALAQAKASGEFDGRDGVDGKDGYTPVKGVDYFDGQPGKKGDKGDPGEPGQKGEQGIQGLKGDKGDTGSAGKDGSAGADGVSPTVAVSKSGKVTTVSITDKNGTKTATINDGADGSPGTAGKDGTSVTVKSVSESTADGGSNVVTFSDGKTVTIKNGSKGSTGAAGAGGKTPVKGTDYWTPADQESIIQQVLTVMGMHIVGVVDVNNNIVLTGKLTDGVYTLKYEDAEGNVTEIGTIDTRPGYTNMLLKAVDANDAPYNGGQGWKANTRLNSSGLEASYDGSECIGFIPFVPGNIIRFGNITFLRKSDIDRNKFYFVQYDANKTMLRNWVVSGFNNPIKAGWVFEDENYNIYQINTGDGVGDGDFNIHPDARYFRINADEINADSIITINEPIV